ncbi:hypothetical protein EJ06DRAFT_483011, partial [Trichodelitschia bisporula]
PTFVFIPAGFHHPDCFAATAAHLIAAGYGYEGVELATVHELPHPETGFDTDVEAVREVLREVAFAGEDIILVMHSYGAFVGSAAAKGFAREHRAVESDRGSVIGLVNIARFAVPEGLSLLDMTEGKNSEFIELDVSPGATVRPIHGREYYYHDMGDAQAEEALSKLHPQTSAVMLSPQTYAAWKHIPPTYVICEQDRCVPLDVQEMYSS